VLEAEWHQILARLRNSFGSFATFAAIRRASPRYLSDILVYIKKNRNRAIIIKITHIIDPTIKRDISAKGLAP
jgi:hypothetical protein